MTELRKGLPPLPARVAALPVDDRGYPVLWFVSKINDKWDFRLADSTKRARAVRDDLCWICGQRTGRYLAFVVGPMCVVNRNTAEPPNHRECAEFAVQACPFLMLPQAKYRAANLPAGAALPPHVLPGNPGAAAIYITESFKPYRTGDSWLIRMGDPVEVTWWSEGRPASRAAILASLEARQPRLRDIANQDGPEAQAALQQYVDRAMALLPAA